MTAPYSVQGFKTCFLMLRDVRIGRAIDCEKERLMENWHWGPNDPILQDLSCDIANMYTGIHVFRSPLVSLPRGRGTKFSGPIASMGSTAQRVNIFVHCTKPFIGLQIYYLVSIGSVGKRALL